VSRLVAVTLALPRGRPGAPAGADSAEAAHPSGTRRPRPSSAPAWQCAAHSASVRACARTSVAAAPRQPWADGVRRQQGVGCLEGGARAPKPLRSGGRRARGGRVPSQRPKAAPTCWLHRPWRRACAGPREAGCTGDIKRRPVASPRCAVRRRPRGRRTSTPDAAARCPCGRHGRCGPGRFARARRPPRAVTTSAAAAPSPQRRCGASPPTRPRRAASPAATGASLVAHAYPIDVHITPTLSFLRCWFVDVGAGPSTSRPPLPAPTSGLCATSSTGSTAATPRSHEADPA
jgi:hypothetical protein